MSLAVTAPWRAELNEHIELSYVESYVKYMKNFPRIHEVISVASIYMFIWGCIRKFQDICYLSDGMLKGMRCMPFVLEQFFNPRQCWGLKMNFSLVWTFKLAVFAKKQVLKCILTFFLTFFVTSLMYKSQPFKALPLKAIHPPSEHLKKCSIKEKLNYISGFFTSPFLCWFAQRWEKAWRIKLD